ncbi:MAG TPA: hypothetical protein PLJ62_02525 [Thermoflexales bacterium]|nr:hypothetical protein [Thermoflexales bacterium]
MNRKNWVYLLVPLVAFAAYAGSLRHMLFYDDPIYIAQVMSQRSLLGVFIPNSWEYRPVPQFFWNLTRDLLGWYVHAPIHFWNVAAHTLCSVLVMALARRVARVLHWRTALFPVLAGLSFAVFPLSFQTVIWAGTIYHSSKALFGLFALNGYLRLRFPSLHPAREAARGQKSHIAAIILCLLASIFSHESGIVFGALILAMELWLALATKTRPKPIAIALAAIALAYPILYLTVMRTYWSGLAASSSSGFKFDPQDWQSKGLYFLQSLNLVPALLIRPIIGLPSGPVSPLVWVMALGLPALGVWILSRAGRALAGLFALSIWLMDALVMSIALASGYILGSPRMLYSSTIGVCIFWALVAATLAQMALAKLGRPVWQMAFAAAISLPALALGGWCAAYIQSHITNIDGLTSGMKQLDADIVRLGPTAKVLLINAPEWSAPAYPPFLLGADADVIYIPGQSLWGNETIQRAPSLWVYGIGGHDREVTLIHHDISFKNEENFRYQLSGAPVDDPAIRAAITQANLVYRFEVGPQGWHLVKLAELGAATRNAPPLGLFKNGESVIALNAAQAQWQNGQLVLSLDWAAQAQSGASTGVFVHVLDSSGKTVFSADRDLIDGYIPMEIVPRGLDISEARRLDVPNPLPGLRIEIGLYDRATGKRFVTTRADGGGWDGDAVRIQD